MLKYEIPESNSVFPVEARIPLFMTMEAVFSFKNLNLGFKDQLNENGLNMAGADYPSVFSIDTHVSKQQDLNIAKYAKQ